VSSVRSVSPESLLGRELQNAENRRFGRAETFLTAESAVARFHFRRTGRTRRIMESAMQAVIRPPTDLETCRERGQPSDSLQCF
jgi:hypothetical protein